MWKKTSQYILGFLFVILVGELILMSPSELEEKKPSTPKLDSTSTSPSAQALPKEIEQMMEGIHVIETRNESKEWELWATAAVGFKEKSDLELQTIRVQFYAEDGVTFEVVGKTGQVRTDAKDMKVDGEVVTRSSNGYVFKTSSLEYSSGDRMLKSPNEVEVTGPRERGGQPLRLSGRDMSADLDKGLVRIAHDVKASKTVQENRRMAVVSNAAQLSGKERAVRFSGNVVIDLNGVKISGPDALFRYDKKDNQLESIDLEGGVRVNDFNKWATSEKLSINVAKNEFVFDGQPRVVQDNDELRGDRIIFLDGGKKVQVHNAKIKVSKESLGAQDSTGPRRTDK